MISTRWRPVALPRAHLVRGEQPRVHQLVQHLLGRPAIGEGREQLLAIDRGPRALGGHQVAEDLAHQGLARVPDPLQRLLGVLRQRTGDAPGLARRRRG